jgi:hypothetical protein
MAPAIAISCMGQHKAPLTARNAPAPGLSGQDAGIASKAAYQAGDSAQFQDNLCDAGVTRSARQ